MFATATSPDGKIQAQVSGPDGIKVTFSRGAFQWYDESALSHQLERLAALSWVAFDRARSEEHRRALGLGVEEFTQNERRSKDERRQRYDADLAAVEADGVSRNGLVRIHSRGMLHWRVDIEPGALRRLGEHRFLDELDTALRALLQYREVRITMIKSKYYDLGVPRSWRDLLNGLANQ